jgi:hypothetical protein
MESLTEIQEKIAEGDMEAAQAFINNPDAYQDEPEYDDSIPTEESLETIQPQQEEVTEQVVVADGDESVNESEEVQPTVDPLQAERDRVDALEADFKKREEQSKAEYLERENGLLKQVEEARNAKDEDETYFFGEDSETNGVDTPKQEEVTDTSDAKWKERFTELEERLTAKEIEDNSSREFTNFWGTEEGKKLKPNGMDANKSIKTLDNFYETLMGYHKNNEKAVMRTLYDLRNPETSTVHTEKLNRGEIEVPEQFDKIFDNWNVRMFYDGVKLDPVTGGVTRFREGKLESLEDAHFLMNKDKLLFEARMETFDQIKTKMNQHQESATTIDPSQTASFADSGRMMDSGYRTALLQQMHSAGFKAGSKDISMIKDPDLRMQAAEIINFM